MKFRAVVELNGKTATGIVVPDDVVTSLGSGKRPAVRVTINGYTYRNTVAPMGGRFLLSVSEQVRTSAGIAAGDDVEVELELDTQPRTVVVPTDFAEALSSHPEAQRAFAGLSYSNRLRYVLSIEDAKTAQTRQRRIDKTIAELGQA